MPEFRHLCQSGALASKLLTHGPVTVCYLTAKAIDEMRSGYFQVHRASIGN